MPQISWYLDSLWTFLSCVQWPTWSRVRNHRHQMINKHVWWENIQTHVNPQQIAEFLYLCRTFLCMFQGISLLYFMLILLRKYHSLTRKVLQEILLISPLWFMKYFYSLLFQKLEVIWPWVIPFLFCCYLLFKEYLNSFEKVNKMVKE